MTWPQIDDPPGNRVLSAAVAALPVLTPFFALGGVIMMAYAYIAPWSRP